MQEMSVTTPTVIVDNDKEKQEKEGYHKRIELLVNSLSNTLARYKNLNDPVLRHMMLIDKLYLTLDLVLGALETIDDVPPLLKQKIDKLVGDTKGELTELSDWVMNKPKNIII
jgi:hypothetical protein